MIGFFNASELNSHLCIETNERLQGAAGEQTENKEERKFSD